MFRLLMLWASTQRLYRKELTGAEQISCKRQGKERGDPMAGLVPEDIFGIGSRCLRVDHTNPKRFETTYVRASSFP
jgi:hypothetical protein